MNKFKKSIVWMLSAFMFISMGACGSPTTYSITWQNYDGTTLEVDNVEQGKVPTYDGTEPTKNSTAEYNYTFDGWTPTIEEATSNKIYTAKFIEHKNSYTVTWDIDGAKYEEKYEYGATPLWKGSNPTKASTVEHSYSFKGWSPALEKVTGNKTYVAEFDQTKNKYIITWDIEGVSTSESYDYGEMPVYKGEKPTKPSDVQYSYSFKGWSPAIEIVTGNKIYTAEFNSNINSYTITWDVEGNKTFEKYSYGDLPVFKGEKPSKPETDKFKYTFAGWSPQVNMVTQDVTYTALFTEETKKYTITWLNDDGTVLFKDENAMYGSTPIYQGTKPSKDSTIQFSYIFSGWTPEVSAVTGDATYRATYLQKLEKAKIVFDLNGGTTAFDSSPIFVDSLNPYYFFFDVKKENYNFRGWSYEGNKVFDQKGNIISSPELAEEMIFTAMFAQDAMLTINTNMPEAGKVLGEGYYPYNSNVDVSVIVNSGYEFIGWYYDGIFLSNQTVYKYTMWSEDTTLEAKFRAASFVLNVLTHQPELGLVMIKNYSEYVESVSQSVEFKTPVTIAAFTKTADHRFLGWYDDYGNLIETNAVYSFMMPFADYHLTAKWEGNEYDIYLVPTYEGAAEYEYSGTFIYGDPFEIEVKPETGYIFDSWTIEGEEIKSKHCKIYMPNHDLYVYANFSLVNYSITYNLNGGTIEEGLNPSTYTTEDFVFFNNPSKTGYTFTGWTDKDGNPVAYLDYYTTGNKYLFATWSVNSYNVGVNYNQNRGSVTGQGTYEYHSNVTLTATAKDGYSFDGWYLDGELQSNSIAYKFTLGAENITYEAKFGKIDYPIDYTINGGTLSKPNPSSYTVEDEIIFNNPTKKGYTFTGWIDIDGNVITKINKGSTGYMYLTANWQINSYDVNVSFNENGGSVTGQGTYEYNSNVTLTASAPNNGYTFDGWFKNNQRVTTSSTYSFTLSDSDVAFEARFTPIKYNISYDLDGGNIDESKLILSYTVEDEFTLPEPTKTAYTFTGWIDENGNDIKKIKEGTTGNISLTATWELTVYKITLDSNGGECDKNSLELTYGSTYNLPTPTKFENLFLGWFDKDNNQFENKGTWLLLEDIVLTAHWDDGTRTYILDAGEGKCDVESIDIRSGKSYELPTPTINKKELDWEYGFDCWLLDGEPIPTKGNFWTYSIVGKTLTARYKLSDDNVYLESKYTFSLNDDDTYSLKAKDGSNYQYAYIPAQYNGKLVTSIGQYAFRGCSSLTSITIPISVTSIGFEAFSNCSSLTIYCEASSKPSGWISSWNYSNRPVVWNCIDRFTKDGINYAIIKDKPNELVVASLADKTLTNIDIPSEMDGKKVTSITENAFRGCSSIVSITIPSSVTSIGSSAFSGCSSLTKVNITDIESWCKISFSSSSSNPLDQAHNLYINDVLVENLVIPNSVTSIGDYTFSGCSSLTSITIPNSLTSIGYNAFSYCSSLTSIIIPDSVTSIGNYAFSYCSSLESITLPFIGGSKDSNTFLGYIFGASSYFDNPNYVPSSLKEVIISKGYKSIGQYAFYGCASLTSIIIPTSVTSIGQYAFNYCSSLTSIIIPTSVTSIGQYAFSSCSSLTSINIPNSVTSIGQYAFSYCSSLTSITIPNSVTSIGSSAFCDCSSLTSITIPNRVTSIGHFAFSDCSSLTSITIPNSVTSIGNYAFYGCSSLTSITIPNRVTSIGNCAFYKCSSLTSITIPNSVTSIGDNAFYGCSSLTIYCEVKSQPIGWYNSWNSSNRPVVWGYKPN